MLKPTEEMKKKGKTDSVVEDELIIKEFKNILSIISEEEKSQIVLTARNILANSLAMKETLNKSTEIDDKCAEELKKLGKSDYITVRSTDFEKAVLMFKLIAEKLDFSKKFRIQIEYAPELLTTSIKFYTTKPDE